MAGQRLVCRRRPEDLADAPRGRTICGERVVLYRGSNGLAALEDCCPHCGAPLSLGFVRDGVLVCGYHGLVLRPDGHACSMPGQRVGSVPASGLTGAGKTRFVWLWPGAPDYADPATIPAMAWAESLDWVFGGGVDHVACEYRLMIDNVTDLSHGNCVHAGSVGQKEIDEAPVTARLEDDQLTTSRFMHNVSAPPFWRIGLRGAGITGGGDGRPLANLPLRAAQRCDDRCGRGAGWTRRVRGRSSAQGRRLGDGSITPETETSHWYVWCMACGFAVDDATVTATVRKGQDRIFAEDPAMWSNSG